MRRRNLASLAGLLVLVAPLVLTGCPALLGIDYEYSAGSSDAGEGGAVRGSDGSAAGGDEEAPDAGGDGEAPDAGGDGEAPDAGGDGEAPDAGIPDMPRDSGDALDDQSSAPPLDASSGVDACDPCGPTPAGWSWALFAPSRDAPCPATSTPTDVVENPAPTSGACTCGACTIDTTATCADGTITTRTGSASCESPGPSYAANGGACTDFTLTVEYESISGPEPQGGSCSAPTATNPAAVTAQADRLCALPTGCGCAAPPPADFARCLVASGTQACPAGTPNQHIVGTSAGVSCSTCGCTFSGTCSGTLSIYEISDCTIPVASLPTGGSCVSTDLSNVPTSSYEWAGTLASESCASGTSTATVALESVSTVCCP